MLAFWAHLRYPQADSFAVGRLQSAKILSNAIELAFGGPDAVEKVCQ
ncbi:MAG: hypothetical protein KDA52_23430 [Planctomycetaceae bacterium]|nr:hypothetical protein [Planctomycetaceae bacterium]